MSMFFAQPTKAQFAEYASLAQRPKLNATRWRTGPSNGTLSTAGQVSFGQQLELRTGAGTDWCDFEFVFANYGISNNDNANDLTIKLSLTYASNNVPIYWVGGGRSKTLVPGETARTASLPMILPGDTTFWLRMWVTCPAGGVWPRGVLNNAAAAHFETPGSDKTDTGSYAGGTLAVAALQPLTVLARPTLRRSATTGSLTASLGMLGDSIASGVGETTAPTNATGFMMRAAEDLGLPWAHTGRSGFSLVNLDTGLDQRRWFQAFEGCSHVLSNLGTNDINAHRDLPTMQAAYALINARIENMGARLIPMTLMPRTTDPNDGPFATDTAADIAAHAAFNTWIRTDPYGRGYIDIAAATADPANLVRWRTDLGTPTVDGIHPASVLHVAAANAVAAALPAILARAER